MKKRKTIFSKTDIENLISELHGLYPKLDNEKISTLDQAKAYFLQLDLLVRSELFRNTLLESTDSIIKLSNDKLKEFLGNLTTHNINLKNTFHELLLGNQFKKSGFEILYQPKYNYREHNNPDWEIERNNQKSVIEVFSLNKYEDYRNEEYFISLLSTKIKKLEEQYNLSIDFSTSCLKIKKLFVNSNLIECINLISSDIEKYLKKNQVKQNTHFDTLFGLKVILSEFKNNQKILGGGAHSPRLIDSFEKKYIKYKDLVNQVKMPLIIACVSDCIARANCDAFEEIIFGIDDSSFSKRKKGVINDENKMPEISGFILFDYNLYSPNFDITYIPNPNAKYPMELIINNKCSKRKNESVDWFL